MAGQQQYCEEKSSDFCYTDMSSTSNSTIQFQTHHQVNHIHSFVSDPTEMFNLTTSMEMIGFSKNLHQQHQDFTPAETTSHENMIVHHDSAAWQQQNRTLLVDDSSLRCLFPSQGLSLSLSSTSTTNTFELRHNTVHQQQQQQQMLQDGLLMNTTKVAATNIYNHQGQGQGQSQFLLKNSKFLLPLQHLLNEFCSLETKQNNLVLKQKSQKFNKKSEDDDNGSGSSINHSLTSLELIELQKRKTKLLSMLEEVDRKYKNYCNQMKAVVSSFEAIAGNGAAIVYSTLALKAMSRHFRCLKDGILEQIEATRKTMGEKDPITPGATRGETPRLRILDRAIRQQRAFQQINMMETQTQPWRPQRGLPECSVSVLRAWLFEHFLHPYPSDVDKHILARQTGLSKSQVSNWFINARVRLWKPMVEEMYLEEEKEQQRNAKSSEGGANNEDDITICTTKVLQNPPSPTDQKPAEAPLLRIDSDCSDHKKDPKNLNPQQQCNSTRATDAFGSVDFDFSSYTHHSSDMQVIDQGFHGGSGVSLTLGLQQHGGSAVNLAFQLPATSQSPMFFTREQIEECERVNQYSFLDGEGQNMQYRNLMGTQLLHDIA